MNDVGDWDGRERRGVAVPAEVVERREHRRYVVEGMAEVVLADGTMLFRGIVLDISVAGCYVETRARLRMAPGTLVEMVFWVRGLVFRPLARSRRVRPGEGAGFLFLDRRVELEALITELGRVNRGDVTAKYRDRSAARRTMRPSVASVEMTCALLFVSRRWLG